MNEQGYGPAQLDKSSPNADAIRGREQQLIKGNGGAQSEDGTSGNAINGISRTNRNSLTYLQAAEEEFGEQAPGGRLATDYSEPDTMVAGEMGVECDSDGECH
jgi:hypothetical protein